MSEIKLLPCPFCGGEAEMNITSTFGMTYTIRCRKCAATKQISTLEKWKSEHTVKCLARAWNTRVPVELVEEPIDNRTIEDLRRDAIENLKSAFEKADYAENNPADKTYPELAEQLEMATREVKGRW